MARHSLRDARGCFVRAADSPAREPRKRVGAKRTSVFLRDDIDFAALEADYRDRTILCREVCAKYRISSSTLTMIVRVKGWRWRAPKPINRHDIIDRLFRLLEGQIEELEIKMGKIGTAEVTALSRLVTSLGRLIDIKDGERAKQSPAETREMSDIKRRLIERIEQLKRG
jgi:hypothetical protein